MKEFPGIITTLALISVFTLLLLFPAKSIAIDENLVPNPDFETDLSHWNALQGEISHSARDKHTGWFSLKGLSIPEDIEWEDKTYDKLHIGSDIFSIPSEHDSTYYFSIWLNKNATGFINEPSTIRILWYSNSGESSIHETLIDFSPYTGWKQITWEGPKPEDSIDSCQFEIYCFGFKVYLYIDDVWFATTPCSTPPKVRDNLVFNPDFETNTSGWMPQEGTLSLSDDDPLNGTHSLKVSSGTIPDYKRGRIWSAFIEDLQDTTYHLSVWVKQATAPQAEIEIYWYQWSYDNNRAILEDQYGAVSVHIPIMYVYDDDWHQITWSGKKWNESTEACKIIISVQKGGEDFDFFIDEVWFSEKPYFIWPEKYDVSINPSPVFANPLLIFFPMAIVVAIRRFKRYVSF